MSRFRGWDEIFDYAEHGLKCFLWIFGTFWIPLVLFGLLAGCGVVSMYHFGWFILASLAIIAIGGALALAGPGTDRGTALASHGKQFNNKED